MRLRRTLVPLAALALAVAGIAAVAPSPASAAQAGPGDTGIVDCAGKIVVKPKQMTITCADAGVSIIKLKWTTWNDNTARGTGVLAWNTCLPETCVDGIVQEYPVRITLGRVASGVEGSIFSRATLRFPETGPAGLQTGTYLLDNAIR
ncbi:MAG: hypothetical protein ACYC2Z_05675 [Candidatus Nanopelagicales bacterium]